eukprot:4651640-Prymnesium_polylepis.2
MSRFLYGRFVGTTTPLPFSVAISTKVVQQYNIFQALPFRARIRYNLRTRRRVRRPGAAEAARNRKTRPPDARPDTHLSDARRAQSRGRGACPRSAVARPA